MLLCLLLKFIFKFFVAQYFVQQAAFIKNKIVSSASGNSHSLSKEYLYSQYFKPTLYKFLMKTIVYLLSPLFFLVPLIVFCQQPAAETDTFFLAKQKGLIGKLGKTISQDGIDPVEKTNPFLKYTGKIIRNVKIKILGFESDINDSTRINRGFGVVVANAFHKNTRLRIIQNNLFFKEGQTINPYLLADNERYLRDQTFIQDAVIHINRIKGITDSVDVEVMTKDVFSLGGGIGISGTSKFRLEAKEENLAGTGSKIAVNTLYDNIRRPRYGVGAEYIQRNISGSFINWIAGFQNYRNAFNSGRSEENYYYTRLEKPLASQYLPWTGLVDASYNKTSNLYADTLYMSDYRYSYYNIDGWMAYNFGAKKLMYRNLKSTVRKFISLRMYKQHFLDVPQKTLINYDGRYADVSGVLGGFSLFRQNFYRSSYIYGFGRNEDVPQGFSASFVAGYTRRQDSFSNKSRNRPYYGIDAQQSNYNKKGIYSTYTFRFGGYRYQGRWEDLDLLFNVDHFTRLKQIGPLWYRRYFFGGGITRQFKPALSPALLLRSEFGLPYFDFADIYADLRATVKSEVVFYHTRRFWGFRFAPFAFADASLLKPTNEALSKSDVYAGMGGGIRTRNENLIFGTMEMRLYYFPHTLPNMNHFKIKFNTNLRFRYNSSFIRRPDFVTPN